MQMNLMEESFVNKEEKKKKRTSTIILIAIFIVLIAIISIIVYLSYVKKSQMKLFLDGKQNEKILNMIFSMLILYNTNIVKYRYSKI